MIRSPSGSPVAVGREVGVVRVERRPRRRPAPRARAAPRAAAAAAASASASRRDVVGVEVGRIRVARRECRHSAPFVFSERSAVSSALARRAVSRRSSATRSGQPVAARTCVDVDAGMDVRQRQLALVAARLEHAEVGDDDAHALAGARAEVEPLDERPRASGAASRRPRAPGSRSPAPRLRRAAAPSARRSRR